jgi:hypothetical protein
MKLKILQEDRGKLLKAMEEVVNAKEFDQGKVDNIKNALDQNQAKIDLAKKENEELSRKLGGGGPVHEICSIETGKPIKQGSHEELNSWVSDLVKSAFGYMYSISSL